MPYADYNIIAELITTVGFPVALVFVLLIIGYKAGKKLTDAVQRNTDALQALVTGVAVLTERVTKNG